MRFKSGKEWTGNRKGAPKKEFRRDDFTDEIFLERKQDIKAVTERLFFHAKNDKPWAIKLVFEYFLTRPKSRDTGESGVHNHDLNTIANTNGSENLERAKGLLLESVGLLLGKHLSEDEKREWKC